MSSGSSEDLLDELRPVSFAIAYRMLGSVAEAEDIVQEALLRVLRAVQAGERIDSPRAFVATITTRLAIDELRSARARRERYVGEWLPEPILTDSLDDPAQHAEIAVRQCDQRCPRVHASHVALGAIDRIDDPGSFCRRPAGWGLAGHRTPPRAPRLGGRATAKRSRSASSTALSDSETGDCRARSTRRSPAR